MLVINNIQNRFFTEENKLYLSINNELSAEIPTTKPYEILDAFEMRDVLYILNGKKEFDQVFSLFHANKKK